MCTHSFPYREPHLHSKLLFVAYMHLTSVTLKSHVPPSFPHSLAFHETKYDHKIGPSMKTLK